MNGAFYISATGLESQQRALEVVANNIANINTPAYKRSEVRFAELLAPSAVSDLDPAALAGQEPLAGVSMLDSYRAFAQGELRETGDPMNLAIKGEGFIELLGPDGQAMLWRGGLLKVGADGVLAAANGMALKAMISAPVGTTAIAIDPAGVVSAVVAGEAQPVELGRIDLVLAKDLAGLTALDGGLYQAANDGDLMTAAPGEDGAGMLVQGSIEGSNVQLAEEMVTLLLMQRAFAANAQVLQAGDQLMAIANGLRR